MNLLNRSEGLVLVKTDALNMLSAMLNFEFLHLVFVWEAKFSMEIQNEIIISAMIILSFWMQNEMKWKEKEIVNLDNESLIFVSAKKELHQILVRSCLQELFSSSKWRHAVYMPAHTLVQLKSQKFNKFYVARKCTEDYILTEIWNICQRIIIWTTIGKQKERKPASRGVQFGKSNFNKVLTPFYFFFSFFRFSSCPFRCCCFFIAIIHLLFAICSYLFSAEYFGVCPYVCHLMCGVVW